MDRGVEEQKITTKKKERKAENKLRKTEAVK